MRHDLKRERASLYRAPTGDFVEVQVPPLRYLAIDGHGDPNVAPEYASAVAALYTTAYSVRAALAQRTGDDFVVGPLEGLWSSADPRVFTARDKASWDWTMLIPLPDQVLDCDVEAGQAAARAKKPERAVAHVELRTLDEGRCLQILHVGSYDDEGPTLARLHDEVMPALGLTFAGPHHEIYLGDPRRAAPEKLRTVLRQPVRLP